MADFNEVLDPIICDAYEEPARHWVIERGQPPWQEPRRRDAYYHYRPPARSTGAAQADDVGTRIPLDLVNLLRPRVRAWAADVLAGRPVAAPLTRELLAYWCRDGRDRRLFFCQREAIETVMFLVEARADQLQGVTIPADEPNGFIRYACKMATGTGKTTVMAGLIAWSILNKVASRRDPRFSDVVLVVCPNVTIRDRLQELDPHRSEASLYRVRDLVPPHLMTDLRKGHVVITNWHALAPQDLSQVGGVGARVVRRGPEADTALVTRVLGPGVGGKGNVLVLNDEAHHAYRIRRAPDGEDDDAEDDDLVADRREATVWIEGLDKLHSVRGINLCVDLSATPFYLNRTGSEAGRAFPWIVSDFGLIDAIESGLVKIPQIPVQDTTGELTPAYFNIWKWIVERKLTPGERGGRRGQVSPEAVLRYAQQPIAQLAGLWRETFDEWARDSAAGRRPPVPPVFIVVCRDTRLARLTWEWLTGLGESAPPPIEEFGTREGREYTVRIDSRVVEDLSTGVARSDESRRLRFVLDTIGKTAWPGGAPPEEYRELVERLNRKAREEGAPLIDAAVPPGRDVRCIVSVAMLTEGWDATTVTHIVGLRPFESQLLCEQVVGRGLRRSQYRDLTVEEVAKVYGVPFELIPLKATPGQPAPPPKVRHVHALSPERDALALSFPRVEGYVSRITADVRVAWDRVPVLRLDPLEIPDQTRVKGLSTDAGGRLSLHGPGPASEVTLTEWRRANRLQALAFDMARALTGRYLSGAGPDIPPHILFSGMLAAVRRYVREKVDPLGDPDRRKDVFLEPYYSLALESLTAAISAGGTDGVELPRYERRGPGSTRDVDFWTSRDVRETLRSHINYVVLDTQQWEQSAAYYLETDEHVIAYAKNVDLGLAIPYLHQGQSREYQPDFLVRLQRDGREVGTLVLEVKGFDRAAGVKAAAARRWVAAVNAEGSHGRWAYRMVTEPPLVPAALASAARELAEPPRPDWHAALQRFVEEARSEYGPRLQQVVLYGSRARGDADEESDLDFLVVVDSIPDAAAERARLGAIASRVTRECEHLVSALPVEATEFATSGRPPLAAARREGRVVG